MEIAPLDANALPTSVKTTELLSFDNAKCGDIYVGLVGGSFLRKGILHLLRAVKSLNRSDIRLVLRSSKSNVQIHPEARRLAKELDVIFVSYLDDINRFYRSIDLFVLPSIDEGFGMVVYEALRNGAPVIATDHVGAIDGMKSGTHFLQVPAQNEEALALAITKLADDPDLRSRLGSGGLDFYRSRQHHGSVYQKALSELLYPFVC